MSSAWRVLGASVTGESHAASGAPCQDACAWVVRGDGQLVVAVSDGAGSASRGDVGARVAVASVMASLRETPDPIGPGVLEAALDVAIAAVHAEADALGVAPRELAATLILAAAGTGAAAAVQIGDGAAVVLGHGESPQALTRPPVGEFVNETTFLVTPGARGRAQRGDWRGAVSALVVFSDGLQRLALRMPSGEPHAPFFRPLAEFAATAEPESGSRDLATFLLSERVASRSDDDRSLIVAVLARGEARAP
ncbi:MAG: hypothetical protein AMXMBFR64_46040 [Myxococcales bacterium]